MVDIGMDDSSHRRFKISWRSSGRNRLVRLRESGCINQVSIMHTGIWKDMTTAVDRAASRQSVIGTVEMPEGYAGSIQCAWQWFLG